MSAPTCPRERLEREQVRYLSREERMNYLATVDQEGKLCWKRNGHRIDTSTKWRDSPQGIVPVEDETAGQPEAVELPGKTGVVEAQPVIRASTSSEDTSTSGSDDAEERGDRYVNKDLQTIKGPRKIVHVSPATILNQLLRTSVRKNTWIFVSASTGAVMFKWKFPRMMLTKQPERSPTRVSISTSASSNPELFSTRHSCTVRASPPPA